MYENNSTFEYRNQPIEIKDMKALTQDYYNNEVTLPTVGDKVLRDGYVFTVSEVVPVDDVFIIASITLRGESGVVSVGYYDYLLHQKFA